MDPVAQENVILSQVEPSSPERPKQNNFLVMLLSVLLLLSVSIAGFFAYQTQILVKELTSMKATSMIVSIEEPKDEPIADWKKYTNTVLKYSFEYPSSFRIIEESSDKVIVSNNLPPDPNCIGGGCNLEIQKFSIYFEHINSPSEDQLSLDEFADQRRKALLGINKDQSAIQTIQKYGYKMKYFDGIALGYSHNYFLKIGGDINLIITSVFPTKEDSVIYLNLEDRILSTFKFTD